MISSEWLRNGIISVIAGCMFAGKTDELIRRLFVLKHAQKKIVVFKPTLDKRFASNKITSHNLHSFAALQIKTKEEAMVFIQEQEKTGKKVDVIAFDEVQFLPIDLLEYIEQWAKEGKIIICAGLDKDYWNEYNSLMSRLLVRTDVVIKLSAICNACNKLACRTQRMKNNYPTDYRYPKILIGGKESYQARCNTCYQDFKNNIKHD